MELVLSKLLEGKKKVALGGHVHPDGDCIGSCMGLYLYLKEQYPNIKTDVYLEEVSKEYNIIQCTDEIKNGIDPDGQYELFICIDCGDISRLGFSSPLFKKAGMTVCIDHHISNEAFADVNYIFPEASSTSELIFGLLDKDKLSLRTAEALYMGIAHDTGVFQYSCTSPETMEAAAELMRKGVDTSKIINVTYYEKTYVQQRLLGKALLESRLVLAGKCIVAVLEKKDMDLFGAGAKDTDGIVSRLHQTRGVEAAVFLYGTDEETYKLSLRSKEKVDVNAIAKKLGGGGHVRAAGATVSGKAEEIVGRICEMIKRQLKAGDRTR